MFEISHRKLVGFLLQAKLGEANKFYYDEKLKKWVEEGVEAAPEAALPPPPPTTSSFMGSSSQDESQTPPSATLKPGIPPMIPSGGNQFSNRRQAGVRSRYENIQSSIF